MHPSLLSPPHKGGGHIWGRGGDLIHLIFNAPIPRASADIESSSIYKGYIYLVQS